MSNVRIQHASARRPVGRSAAFTLVELLTVVGIIALLLSISVGVMVKVGGLREMTGCASNLRSIGVAAWTFAMDESGRLPTHHLDEASTFDTVSMRRGPDQFVNLGQLLDYVSRPQTLYCPSHDENSSPALAYDTPENPFTKDEPQNGDGTAVTRRYDPPVGVNASFPARSIDKSAKPGNAWAIRHYSNRVIYSDFIGVDGWSGPGRIQGIVNAPHDDAGYNRLFGDGAVHWADSEPLEQLFAEANGSAGGINDTEPNGEDLRAYYELLDVLP